MKPLSSRQRQVLDMICQGKQSKEIARVMKIAPQTVGTYVERICAKMGVPNRVMAALEYDRKKR